MIRLVLSGKDANSTAEYDLRQRSLLACTPLDAKVNPFVLVSRCSETLCPLPMIYVLVNSPVISFTDRYGSMKLFLLNWHNENAVN